MCAGPVDFNNSLSELCLGRFLVKYKLEWITEYFISSLALQPKGFPNDFCPIDPTLPGQFKKWQGRSLLHPVDSGDEGFGPRAKDR